MTGTVLKIVILHIFIAVVNSAPIKDESLAEIIENNYTIDVKGNYVFSFKTTNDLIRYEEGIVVNSGEPNEHIEVYGYYSYINDAGEPVRVDYSATEEGYKIGDEQKDMTISGLPQSVVASLVG
ncbi:cuticular protein RR-1 motif 31 precursor [Bombyx mori]|uniref:Putative cuticle protein n=1 Tax=Bombyx mori TaxID=7091 RepID=C0H6M3_BOMMO|nr:cuticular protein RR-1 motif 31 precursor [Bombyx mori]FAA00534.1 TPA: putative cuticle protein [Bombyx mori]